MREQIVSVASLVIAIAILAAPLGMVVWLARTNAIDRAIAYNVEYAGWTLRRASVSLDEARSIIDTVRADRPAGCSDEAVSRMRSLALGSGVVEQVSIFDRGRLDCTSWSEAPEPIAQGEPVTTYAGDYRLYLDVMSSPAGGPRMMGLGRDSVQALLNPHRLVDVIADRNLTLVVATRENQIVASTDPTREAEFQALLDGGTPGGYAEGRVYARVEDDNLVALVVSDGYMVADEFRALLISWMPAGLTVSALLAALMFREFRSTLR